MADSTSDDESWIKKNWVILIAFLVMACVIGFYFYEFSLYTLFDKDFCINTTGDDAECLSKDAVRWGTFGDFVGGTLNPILSFLALVVLLKTYSSQREELEDTKTILKEQTATQKKQQFESTFFELLKVHNQSLENLLKFRQFILPDGEKVDLFSILMEEIFAKNEMTLKAAKIAIFEKLELEIKKELWGGYFRLLYQLLKFIAINSDNGIDDKFEIEDIKENDISYNEKMYSNIVRTLLPDDIMKLLSVSCYIEGEDKKNYHKYKALIERYAFFEHASFNEENDSHQIFVDYPVLLKARNSYNSRAFGK